MQFEEFAPCTAWWKSRAVDDHAWKVVARDALKYDDSGQLLSANLDLKNPNGPEDLEHLSPEKLVDDILKKEKEIIEIVQNIKRFLELRPG